jgi:DNA topoisomerase-6 subunit B
VLPEVAIEVREVTRHELDEMLGVGASNRIDETLYRDHAAEVARQKKLKKQAAGKSARGKGGAGDDGDLMAIDLGVASQDASQAATESSQLPFDVSTTADASQLSQLSQLSQQGAVGGASATAATSTTTATASASSAAVKHFTIKVTDNGMGMAHDDIPTMLGRVLTGSKGGVKQARGKFGLGAKMALIWSKMSTGLPIVVRSAQHGSSTVSVCVLSIDIARNEPIVVRHVRERNDAGFRGTTMAVTIEGNWSAYRARVLQYVRQLSIITPYADFSFAFVASPHAIATGASSRSSFELRFDRRSDQVPTPPTTVKHHPSSVNLVVVRQALSSVSPRTTLAKFLETEFSSISKTLAVRLVGELGGGLEAKMKVQDLTDKDIFRIDRLLRAASFPPPSGECLSPVGEYNIRLGVLKVVRPDLVATFQAPARVQDGHPFIVEAAVAIGGRLGSKEVRPGLNVFRFANRIPLLFEGGSDVMTRTASEISWGNYKINKRDDRVSVFLSIVSTRIPFKGTSKEYISYDCDEIRASVRVALMQCALQLKAKLVRRATMRQGIERKSALKRYIPDVSRAMMIVLESMHERAGKRQRTTERAVDRMLGLIDDDKVSQPILAAKLNEAVEMLDKDEALGLVTARNKKHSQGACPLFLAPRDVHREEPPAVLFSSKFAFEMW